MKTSDSTTTPTFRLSLLSSKKNKPTKPFKFNRRLNNRMATLSKGSPPLTIPINSFQIIPVTSLWTNNQSAVPSSTVIPMNTFPTSVNTPSSFNQQQQFQHVPVYSSYKPFTAPRVTTTLIPLNVHPVEYPQQVKQMLTSSSDIAENHHEQKTFGYKPKSHVTTHLIDDWIIRESSEPFQRKENERATSIKQLANQEKQTISNESIVPCQSSPLNVNQWTTDDVCFFFERILEKNCYSPIIKEHLIDGTALVLLQDEHLASIFKMQLGPRLKLLNRIKQLKTDVLPTL